MVTPSVPVGVGEVVGVGVGVGVSPSAAYAFTIPSLPGCGISISRCLPPPSSPTSSGAMSVISICGVFGAIPGAPCKTKAKASAAAIFFLSFITFSSISKTLSYVICLPVHFLTSQQYHQFLIAPFYWIPLTKLCHFSIFLPLFFVNFMHFPYDFSENSFQPSANDKSFTAAKNKTGRYIHNNIGCFPQSRYTRRSITLYFQQGLLFPVLFY